MKDAKETHHRMFWSADSTVRPVVFRSMEKRLASTASEDEPRETRTQTLAAHSSPRFAVEDPSLTLSTGTVPMEMLKDVLRRAPIAIAFLPFFNEALVPVAYTLCTITIFSAPLLDVIPRLKRDGDVGKLPLLPYSMMFVNSAVWCAWALLCDLPAVWASNLVGVSLSLYYTSQFCRVCPKTADWLPFTKPVHLAGMTAGLLLILSIVLLLPTDSATFILGLVGNATVLTLYASPLASIRAVLAMKSTKYLPFDFTCSTFCACTLGTYYSFFMINDPMLGVPNLVGALVAAAQLALLARFGIYRG